MDVSTPGQRLAAASVSRGSRQLGLVYRRRGLLKSSQPQKSKDSSSKPSKTRITKAKTFIKLAGRRLQRMAEDLLVKRTPKLSPVGPPIHICVSNGEAYIWAVEEVERLRIDHQICGLLTGTLPQLAQQNVFLGLPLQLMPEEVVVLVDLGIAVLVDERKSHRSATIEDAHNYLATRAKEIEEETQSLALRDAERRRAMENLYQSQIAAAEEKRQARKQLQAQALIEHTTCSAAEGMIPPDEVTEEKSGSSSANIPRYISIPLRSQPPTYTPQSLQLYDNLKSAREAGLWTYPNNKAQKARCAVFSDLWRSGRFLGIGLKFGCDFLVYPGDTLRFHSHFACTVISDPQASIAPLSLVSYGRLATAVKKAHLLACWDEETNTVNYLSLEWAGMG
ncbi:hypothetical protein O181_051790 [Austropuccinia psidii MF-1]|uniref:tRNA-splicing endonuclease subunit SEN34 n=1 Tax=Austropuccinia psidii MF-1 TaxID=1389203 RepID=A0A9Q3E3P1_9BASI|nr:hypothetical protein [Austropuccinia psidii MF-1]